MQLRNFLYSCTAVGMGGLFMATTAQAELVSVSDDVFIDSYSGASSVLVAMDTNPVTGEYVVCFAEEDSAIKCSRRDADDNGLSNVFFSTGTSGRNIDFNNLDVALNDAGDVYVMWTGESVSSSDTVAFVQAFDSSGSDLFNQRETTFGNVDRASMALTPSAVWILGVTREVSDFFEVDVTVQAEYFNTSGVSQGTVSIFSESYATIAGLTDCQSIDVASNRSGDLVMTWIEPNDDNVIFDGVCTGSVFAQTYRESGGSISDVTQISDTETNDDGDDVSAFFDPVATAYENGEYVIAWTDGSEIYSANLALNGDIATSQESTLSGSSPKIGGNSASEDYVVTSELSAGSSCVIEARLAFDADTDPSVVFAPADCNHDNDINFLADGQMIIARTTTDTGSGDVVINRIGLPAEVEVSSVSVLEGNPSLGTGGVAAVDVVLTRAHPAGEDIEVSYFTRDDTALLGIDYEFTQGTLTFDGSSGELSQTVLVPIIADDDFEDDEIFDFILENPVNAVLKNGGDSADITIENDDSTPAITADCTNGDANNCQEIQEPVPGETTQVTVNLSMAEAIDSDISVSFSTSDGTATAGEDYVETSGTLQFLAGSTEASFVLTVIGDDVSEDTETFTVSLSASGSINLPDTELTFSILNDTVCFIEIDPNAAVATAAGGSEGFNVTTLDTCSWDVSTNVDWVTITSSVSNTGSGSVSFDVDMFDPPEGVFTRSGLVTVTLTDPDASGSADFIIDQDGDCSFTIDSSSMNFDVSGGTGSFNVTANDESCDWDATSSVDWVTITEPTEPVMGDGTVQYSVNDNADIANVENGTRTVVLTSEQFEYTISQDGCTFSLDNSSATVASDGDDSLTVDILAPTSASGPCPWTAVSNASWILVADGASGTGGDTITLDVLENPSVESRTGTVTIGDETFTVDQDGEACSYEVSPESLSICPDGDTFEVTVTATDGCSWSLTPQQDWIEVLTNSSGLGSETATGAIVANLSEDDRSSSIELLVTRFGASVDSVVVDQDGFLIYEDFSAGLPVNWTYDQPNNWSVAGDDLLGNRLGLNAPGAAYDLTRACKDCKVETTATVTTVSSSSFDSLTLVGWYEDDNNLVGLAMDEFANRWRLFQVASGVVTESEVQVDEIVPNTAYELTISYDGETFFAQVDGQTVTQLDRQAGTDPIGFTGFMVENNIARFEDLRVIGEVSDFNVLFEGSFEAPTAFAASACTL